MSGRTESLTFEEPSSPNLPPLSSTYQYISFKVVHGVRQPLLTLKTLDGTQQVVFLES